MSAASGSAAEPGTARATYAPGPGRAVVTVAARELAGLFVSPIAYIALTGVALAMSLFFFDNLRAFNAEVSMMQAQAVFSDLMAGEVPPDLNLIERVMVPTAIQTAFVFLGVVPLITMGVFAEERVRRTDEVLLTLPLPTTAVVAGKFLATYVFLLAVVGVTVLLPVVSVAYTGLSAGPVLASALGLLLLAFALAAVGLVCSALTSNQLVAALAAYALASAAFDFGWLQPLAGEWLAHALELLAIHPHFASFPRGVIPLADVGYFAVICLTGFLLTRAALELERLK
ncbi:MAG: ABC transporter permease [Gammaproteobacteria bacterium]|nr:ABC transporter permease [Gammaproteobacteria bacterium]